MTARAVLLGLVGAATICGLTYFNDFVLQQTFLVGNHMPVSVYGTLLVFLLVNAALFRLARRMALSGKEIALVLGMTLVACSVPGGSLMRTFTVSLALPRHYNKSEPGWQENGLVDRHTPDGMLVDVERSVAEGRLTPADPEGFVERLKEVYPDLSADALMYVGEALTAFNRRVFLGSVVMLGVAAEAMMHDLAESMRDSFKDGDAGQKWHGQKIANRPALRQHKAVMDRLVAIQGAMPRNLAERVDTHVRGIGSLIRQHRNEAAAALFMIGAHMPLTGCFI